MSKPKKTVIEYRNYELPLNFPILLLTGDRWHISDVKSGKLHFHNCLEIGICHSDSGMIEFDNDP
ncbi:MAG: AraC family transcriptional regulator, partial [Butyrivibrio sp.]|nr:AraC family transcriptional regulator [Butyrivibrio sp.]